MPASGHDGAPGDGHPGGLQWPSCSQVRKHSVKRENFTTTVPRRAPGPHRYAWAQRRRFAAAGQVCKSRTPLDPPMLTQEGQVLCTRLKQCLETGLLQNLEGQRERFFVFLCVCEKDMTILIPGKLFSDAKRCTVRGLTCASCSFIYLLTALKVVTVSFSCL